MTSDSEINREENEQEASNALPVNRAYKFERAPGLDRDPATTDLKDNRINENSRAYGSAAPSLIRLDELDVDSTPTPPSVVAGQRTADHFQPASELLDQLDTTVIGPVSGPYEPTAIWRGQHFTGTLGFRMAQAKKVAIVLSFPDVKSSSGAVVDEQTTRPLALAAAVFASAVNSFAKQLNGWQAKINKPSFTEPNTPFRAAGFMIVLAAMFVGGSQSIGNRTSEVAHKINEQKRLIDEMFGKLKLQEEKLLTLEVETRGSAEETKRLIVEERAWLKAEIERKMDEKLARLEEADEKKGASDGLAAKRQATGQKRASESDKELGSAHRLPNAALETPIARPSWVPRPDVTRRQN